LVNLLAFMGRLSDISTAYTAEVIDANIGDAKGAQKLRSPLQLTFVLRHLNDTDAKGMPAARTDSRPAMVRRQLPCFFVMRP